MRQHGPRHHFKNCLTVTFLAGVQIISVSDFAHNMPREEIWAAHTKAKERLVEAVNQKTNAGLDSSAFTLGFARRFTPYKRGTLLLADPARLKEIAARAG